MSTEGERIDQASQQAAERGSRAVAELLAMIYRALRELRDKSISMVQTPHWRELGPGVRFRLPNGENITVFKRKDGAMEVVNPFARSPDYVEDVVRGALRGELPIAVEVRYEDGGSFKPIAIPALSDLRDFEEAIERNAPKREEELIFLDWLRERSESHPLGGTAWQQFREQQTTHYAAQQLWALAAKLDAGGLKGLGYSVESGGPGRVRLFDERLKVFVLEVEKPDLIAPAKVKVKDGVEVEQLKKIGDQLKNINRAIGSRPFSTWLMERSKEEVAQVMGAFIPVVILKQKQKQNIANPAQAPKPTVDLELQR